MHTFLLIAAYLLATTLATPVAQLFDTFEEDFASLNNQQGIKNLPQDFNSAVGELESDGSTGQGEGGNNAPLFLTGDTTTNYLQAQVSSQVTFSNFGAGCPSGKLFCCQGGSGSPGTLISDAAFNGRCIPYNDQNTLDDKCQVESNGSCCQSENAPGGAKVWQCVTTPIKVVPREHQSSDEPQTPKQDPETPDPEDRSATPRSPNRADPDRPLLNNGKGNWQYL